MWHSALLLAWSLPCNSQRPPVLCIPRDSYALGTGGTCHNAWFGFHRRTAVVAPGVSQSRHLLCLLALTESGAFWTFRQVAALEDWAASDKEYFPALWTGKARQCSEADTLVTLCRSQVSEQVHAPWTPQIQQIFGIYVLGQGDLGNYTSIQVFWEVEAMRWKLFKSDNVAHHFPKKNGV